ncbi:MAG TPA: T9SS type A sorting domain-containing protein [Bacteroidales bacterium]|nr:T9SS type A sorting domain-containing protein [Bacteroidales bacterium]
MKNTIFLVLIVNWLTNLSFGQTPNWLWAKSSGGTLEDVPNIVTTDASGNVYIAGYFRSPSIILGSDTLTDPYNGMSGNTDWFIVKYDSIGNVLWTKNGKCIMSGIVTSLKVDILGNVYAVGYGRGQFTVGSVTIANALFILKYDANGNLIWAKSMKGYGDWASIALDHSGNAYMTGNFRSDSLIFGYITLVNAHPQAWYHDIFLAKLDTNGNILWAKSAGGINNDNALSIAIDNLNNVYITGYDTSPSISFDSVTFENTGVFLVKYDTNGNVIWAKNFIGTGWGIGACVAVDNAGNPYVTGYYDGYSLYVDSIILTNYYPASNDVFFIKTDMDGNVHWAKSAGGYGFDFGLSVAVDAFGSSYFVGSFKSDSITFGSLTLDNSSLTYDDIYIVKYDTDGNALWAINEGGTQHDGANSVAVDAAANLYVTGGFRSPTLTFNNITLTNHYVGISHMLDIFIAKMKQPEVNGIDDLNRISNISVSPNPFSLSTKISFGQTHNSIGIEVYNIQGQLISKSRYADCSKILFNKNKLSSGLYVFKIIVDDKIAETKKIVICD